MLSENRYSGIVSLHGWTAMQDGDEYRYVWCAHWEIQTDKEMPVDGFRSSERWQLIAYYLGKPVMIVPGCQVAAFVMCDECPTTMRSAHAMRFFSIDRWLNRKGEKI